MSNLQQSLRSAMDCPFGFDQPMVLNLIRLLTRLDQKFNVSPNFYGRGGGRTWLKIGRAIANKTIITIVYSIGFANPDRKEETFLIRKLCKFYKYCEFDKFLKSKIQTDDFLHTNILYQWRHFEIPWFIWRQITCLLMSLMNSHMIRRDCSLSTHFKLKAKLSFTTFYAMDAVSVRAQSYTW